MKGKTCTGVLKLVVKIWCDQNISYIVKCDVYNVKLFLLLVVETLVTGQFIILLLLHVASGCALKLRLIDFQFSQNSCLFEAEDFLLFWASLRKFYCIYPCLSARVRLLCVSFICCDQRWIEISVTTCVSAPLCRPRRRWEDNIKMDVY